MKNNKLIILTLALLGLSLSARASVSVGVQLGVPVYTEPQPYVVEADESAWWNTPAQVIYVDGAPHRMHMWHGHWYDEAWAHHHHPAAVDTRYDDRHHGGWHW